MSLGTEIENIKCIILDSWKSFDNDSMKLLIKLSETNKNIPIIVMQTIDDANFMDASKKETFDREFWVLHLLALPRDHIRKVVSAYNEEKHIGDENAVIKKVVTDLEVLNIHRTPLNCLTLLKVSEKYFDESPVNRTKMLEMVLFLLFDMDDVPTYKTKPDLKDCEYVLGRFCEKMIRSSIYHFSRDEFLQELNAFCAEKLIDLEVDVVFDVLFSNNIIVARDSIYYFRFAYWIYYFAAQRMHQDQNFAKYVFEERRYASYPEIVEFYTGIDRRREDALSILLNDIKEICNIVHDKVGLPDDMNPYRLAQWKPSQASIEKMQSEISENVLNSKLPDLVKDQYADRGYDKIKPYDQTVHTIFNEYSLAMLIQCIKASSRGLRNSDYANPEIKRELLKEIIRGWEQISKVIIAITPILAAKGNATYDGMDFILSGDFGDTFKKKIDNILSEIPFNLVMMYRNDLFSRKMGPLLYDHLNKEKNALKKHELILLIIYDRPRNWKTHVENYIASISKDSFYLADIVSALREEYKYSYASPQVLIEIAYLIKMGLAKHQFGIKKPLIGSIKRIGNQALPKREVDEMP